MKKKLNLLTVSARPGSMAFFLLFIIQMQILCLYLHKARINIVQIYDGLRLYNFVNSTNIVGGSVEYVDCNRLCRKNIESSNTIYQFTCLIRQNNQKCLYKYSSSKKYTFAYRKNKLLLLPLFN